MAESKMVPTSVKVETFLSSVSEKRQAEAHKLIEIMQSVSGTRPVMWGPSIVGFGNKHYRHETGREGEMPALAFSPRKSSITIYFMEGFDRYSNLLERLGKYKTSVSCLYINKLEDVDIDILRQMIEESYGLEDNMPVKPKTVEEYIALIPPAARAKFDQLRNLVKETIPSEASEVFSYGIVGYKVDDKRAKVFISGWKDHVSVYPVPKDKSLQVELKPYIKGKGTLWFSLDENLPEDLIRRTVESLVLL